MKKYLKSVNPTLPLHSSSRKERLKEGVFSVYCVIRIQQHSSLRSHISEPGEIQCLHLQPAQSDRVWMSAFISNNVSLCLHSFSNLLSVTMFDKCLTMLTMFTFHLRPAQCDNVRCSIECLVVSRAVAGVEYQHQDGDIWFESSSSWYGPGSMSEELSMRCGWLPWRYLWRRSCGAE